MLKIKLRKSAKKPTAVPRIFAELSLALSVGLLCLVGALSQQAFVSVPTILFVLTLILITLLVNSVPSGLKDIKADQEAGGSSFVLSVGSFVIAGDQLYISPCLRIFALTLQLAIIVGLFVTANQFSSSLFLKTGILFSLLVGTMHLVKLLWSRSFKTMRRSGPLLNGFCNYFALLLVLIPHFPFGVQLVFGMVILLILYRSWLMRGRAQRKRRQQLINLGG